MVKSVSKKAILDMREKVKVEQKRYKAMMKQRKDEIKAEKKRIATAKKKKG